ncbi:MAG: GAF domain-containing protein, partial [Anaerolineae bacterium]|nr:GAF domain-containing protein [Anaerolineae bacterium]
ITERKRAEEEIKRRAAQAMLGYEVGQRVSSKLELDELLSEIVTAVRDAFDYYGVMILLVDEEAQRLTMQSIAGGYADIFPRDLYHAIGEGMTGYAVASGKTQVSGNVSKDPHYVREADEETKSELAVPIKKGQKVSGVLDIQSDEFDAFDETGVMLMETLADQIAVAIENARLYEAVQQELAERKRAEEELKEYSERLEEMVEQRTEELREAQGQLIRREKLAVLGQLAGGVGHELRNPLGAIKNAVYLLNMILEEPEPEVREALEIVEKEVGTCDSIIRSLLDFARTKAPVRREVGVNDVLRAALVRITIPEGIEVMTQLDEAVPIILADPDQLVQAFGNIILNGIQAMPEGGRLLVKTARLSSPKTSEVSGKPPRSGWVAVSFADTGVGIPE